MEIHSAGPADVEALASLRWRWRVEEEGERGDRPQFTEVMSGWMAAHVGSCRAWLAAEGPEPIGMAWLAIVDRVPSPGRWIRQSGSVQSVYVTPAHRNRGIGAALVEAVITEGRALGLDYLYVHPSERSFPLYRRLGFGDAERALELDLRGS